MKAAVRNAAELGVGDVVRTPTQRLATVTGFSGDYVLLVYLADDCTSDENDAVTLWPGYVSLVRKAAPPADADSGNGGGSGPNPFGNLK